MNSTNKQLLMQFDCIFSSGINRFVVDLMINQVDNGKVIVDNIGFLINQENVTMSQKNQMAFLLGRVTDRACRNKAIEILSKEYRSWDWKQRMTTSAAMYIRTVGISLTYLGAQFYIDGFYEKLIYNGYLSKINRNFHIQYFLTDGYRFESELKLDDKEMCSVEKIDSLFKYLYHSIFDSRARKESKCINIITILNLTVLCFFATVNGCFWRLFY